MPSTTIRADGSSLRDAEPTVEIDLSGATNRWRYCCPNGHPAGSWSTTNNHLYCQSCLRQMENGSDVSPEHYEIWDKEEDVLIPYARVKFVG